jgi:hypothetical protein
MNGWPSVPLAEPDRYVLGFEEVVQFSRGLSPIVPSVAEEQVIGLGARSHRFDFLAVAVQRRDLARGVADGGVGRRPTWMARSATTSVDRSLRWLRRPRELVANARTSAAAGDGRLDIAFSGTSRPMPRRARLGATPSPRRIMA